MTSHNNGATTIETATRHVLSNGMIALIQRNPNTPTLTVRGEVRVGAVNEPAAKSGLAMFTGGALANVMKAAQAEAERILDDCETGLAGPGIDYVREHSRTIRRWLGSGRRFRVWTVDSENDVALCQGLGIHEITTNRPAQVLAQLSAGSRIL